jgi:hypothetical protein
MPMALVLNADDWTLTLYGDQVGDGFVLCGGTHCVAVLYVDDGPFLTSTGDTPHDAVDALYGILNGSR